MNKVTICDYGVGNLLSVERALIQCGAEVTRTTNRQIILDSPCILLPGVGAFGHCVQEIINHDLWQTIIDFHQSGKKILGICVGMQLLYQESHEFGIHQGFGFTAGAVDKIPSGDHKIPFIGWAQLHEGAGENPLLQGINHDKFVYFVHSFHGQAGPDRRAFYQLGPHQITAMVQHDNVWGCQFHPEKSGHVGLQILRNWLSLGD